MKFIRDVGYGFFLSFWFAVACVVFFNAGRLLGEVGWRWSQSYKPKQIDYQCVRINCLEHARRY